MDIQIHLDDAVVTKARRALNRSAAGVAGLAILGAVAWAAPLGAVPYVFQEGDVISASEVNANFAAVVDAVDAVDAAVADLAGDLAGVDAAVGELEAFRTIGFRITAGGTVSGATFSPNPTLQSGPASPYTITLPSGLFASTPICTVSMPTSTAVAVSPGINARSATVLDLGCWYDFIGSSSDGACDSSGDQFNVICIGRRP